MTLRLTRFDRADTLLSEEDMAVCLAECAEGDDPALIAHALGAIARARNLSRLARETGMTRAGLSRALARDGNPSFATISKVAKALGLKVSIAPAKATAGRGAAKPSRRAAPATMRRVAPSRKVAG
ncbi:MAG: addiction module antidote protein [Roseiarcus sp.]|jgi:probable addiction module antidote protein